MKTKLSMRTAVVATVLALGLVAQPAMAAEMTREVQAKLLEAQKAGGDKAVSLAKDALSAGKSSYDKEMALKVLLSVAFKAKDYRAAVQAAEGLLEGGFAKGNERLTYTKYVADLSIQTRDYAKAASYYQKYLDARGAGASEKDYFDAAQVANLTGSYSQVMAYGDKVAATGRPRSEKMLLLQYNAAGKLGQAAKQRALMEELAKRFGKGEYLANMIAIHSKANGDKSMILNLYRLAADRGGLKGQELGVSFVQDLISAGAMSEAQAFLKKAGLKKDDKVKGLERQAASFSEAEQKALPVKDKEARAAKNGENDYRVALTYFGMGKYAEAAEAARRAVQPDRIGRIKRPDEAQMLLGMALARGKKIAEAKAAFAEARKEAKMAAAADLWMAVAK